MLRGCPSEPARLTRGNDRHRLPESGGILDGEIIVRQGKSEGSRFPVREGRRLSVGRSVRADIQMFDEGLGRLHCMIENRGSEFAVTALDGPGGTLVNDSPAGTDPAYAGDRVKIGPVVLEFAGPARPVETPEFLAGSTSRDEAPPSAEIEEEDASPAAELVEEGPSWVETHDIDAADGGSSKGIDGEYRESGTELIRMVDPGATGILRPGDVKRPGRLKRAHRDLVTIYRVANTINALSDPHELAGALVQTVAEVIGADRATVLLESGGRVSPDPFAVGGKAVSASDEVRVSQSVVDEVVRKGVSVLSRNVAEDARYSASDSLVLRSVQSMMCVPLLAQGEVTGVLYVDSRKADAFDEQDMELLASIGNQAGVALQRVRLLSEFDNLFFSTIRSLVRAIDLKDGYTHGHSERVTAFALKLAGELGLSRHEREVLQLAGLLHDVGKIGVPESVLNKPGELTDAEFEQMKLHPVHGAEIVSNIESRNIPEIALAIRHHHERWDGSGYPDGLAGEALPLAARVLALADAFDAMTSDRPYQKGFSMDRAVEVVRSCSGTQFAPDLAVAFVYLHKQGKLVLPKTMALKYTTMATPEVD